MQDGKVRNINTGRGSFGLKDAGAGYLCAILALLIPQLVLGIVWAVGVSAGGWPDLVETQKTSFAFLILSGAGLQLCLLLAYYLFTRYNKIHPFAAPRVKPMPGAHWLLSAAAGVVALFGLMFTSFAFDILFTDVFKYQSPELPGFDTAGRAALGIIFMAALPAVIEELIFRGVVLRGLEGLGRNKAVLISAAAFAMAHMSPAQTVHQFLLGIIMGLMAWETGSILAPMLIHFINNALAITLEASGFFSLTAGLAAWEITVIALVTFCAVCGIMYVILRLLRKPKAPEGGVNAEAVSVAAAQFPAKKRLADERHALMFLLAGFIITAVMWIFAMLPADLVERMAGG